MRNWLGVAADESELRVRVSLRRRLDEFFRDRAPEIYPYLGSILGVTLEPAAASRLAELSPEALQYRTFEVVGALLVRLAEEDPSPPHSKTSMGRPHVGAAGRAPTPARGRGRDPVCGNAAVRNPTTRSGALKEAAARSFPHRTRELALMPLFSGDADRELLAALVGERTLPLELEERILDAAAGNPFFLEELSARSSTAGRSSETRRAGGLIMTSLWKCLRRSSA